MDINFEPVDACPVCGGEGSFDVTGTTNELGKNIDIHMYSCADCESVYHNPRMTKSVMDEYYASGVFRETHEDNGMHEDHRAARLISILEYKNIKAPKRCLDVGSSRGYLLSRIQDKYGAETVGLDLYSDPDAVIAPVTDRKEVIGKFDLITCIHTLEHFHDPMKELAWMKSKLAKGGKLLVEIPMVKKVIHPHPVLFSRKSIPIIMEHVGLDYELVEVASHIGVVIAYDRGVNEAAFYDDIYLEKPGKWGDGEGVQRDMFAYKALKEYVLQSTERFVLDYGCGNGHTLLYFQSMISDARYDGVDISEIALKLARSNVPTGIFSTELETFANIILCMGVAEHFEEPAKQLREIGEHLFADGILYLEVPNCLGDSDDEGFRVTYAGAGQHEWHWKRSTWEQAIEEAGFDIVEKLVGESQLWEFIWILKKAAVYDKSDAELLGLRRK